MTILRNLKRFSGLLAGAFLLFAGFVSASEAEGSFEPDETGEAVSSPAAFPPAPPTEQESGILAQATEDQPLVPAAEYGPQATAGRTLAPAAAPVWTFDLDEEERLGVVSVEAADAESLAVPAASGEAPVRAIGPNAFAGCDALKYVSIPASVEWIDPLAFAGCAALQGILVDEGNEVYSDIDGALCDAEGRVLLTVPPGLEGSYTIPEGIEAIDDGAFAGCALLTELVLRPGILDIRPTAFAGCDGLLSVLAPRDGAYDLSVLGLPEGCAVTYYEPGGLDDPTLPPRWAAAFKANGGSGTMAEQVFLVGVADFLRANAFSRVGHTFTGWARSAGGPAVFADGQSVLDLAEAGQRLPLFAKWTPNRYTLVLKANGGTGSMAPIPLTWGTAHALPPSAFRRTGYTFEGWATTPGGAVRYKDGQSVRNLCATANGTATLYAKWQGVEYKVVLHEQATGGSAVTQTLRFGTKTPLRKNPFSHGGQMFTGWARSPNGPVAFKDQQPVSSLVAVSGGTAHLYAQWAARNYKVRFMANGGSGFMADQAHVYGTTRCLSANTFRRTGYSFEGWSTTPTGPVRYANLQPVSSLSRTGESVTLYARWRLNRYTVVFDANGGSGTMAGLSVAYGQKARLPANGFYRASHVFAGWAKTRGGKTAYGNASYVQNLAEKDGAEVRLYARWAVRNYSVAFNANGGTGSMAAQTFSYETARELPVNSFSREGYEFVGWATEPSGSLVSFVDGESIRGLTEGGGRVTLYAIWRQTRDPNLVVCLGDSITEGYRCIGDPYPTRLARMSGRTVRNYGKGGKLSAYGAAIAEDTLKKELPGVVCILFGANDAIHEVNPSVTKANLRSIIRTCRKYNAKPIIGTPTPQIGNHEQFNDNVNAIVRQVRILAREEGVTLVDLNSAFGDGKRYLNPADGLHLSDAGGNLMARMFNDAL